jgi:hypothetical protein
MSNAAVEDAVVKLRDNPFFQDFIKTLSARRDDIVSRLVALDDDAKTGVLRGEIRAYDFIIKRSKA